eukprot:CAMPEP_0180518560 /NCGR_PEP_ID=MMETSP1036_2-20121128/55169_1 /TAXON_ID=632150 /ORGANISM="Azadinium spinosum, Strain 3D9" /LENGTH=45 /DNA_ID= /DNA_START= /DNA_END= /DNA_ORIENTATION=
MTESSGADAAAVSSQQPEDLLARVAALHASAKVVQSPPLPKLSTE